jgi:hypothetical protein
MSAESWAKLGIMMLDGGVFEGKRILSERWVKQTTTMHSKTPEVIGPYNYGYQLWVSRKTSTFLFNGMLGQNVWICPTNNIVVVANAGNNEIFQNSPAMAILEKYLAFDLSGDLKDSCFVGDLGDLRRAEEQFFVRRHWVRPYEPLRGLSYRLGLRDATPYPEEWDELIGKYHFVKNNYGMLPLFIRGMQNNLHNSIDGIEFEKVGDRIFFVFYEGGESYRLEVGFYDFKTTILDYHGEKYIVKVIGEAMEDEDREMLYKLELLFPEMPNTRMIKLSFVGDGQLLMRMSEMPNHRIADVFLAEMTFTDPKMAFLISLLENRIGKNFMARKVEEVFSPRLIGARVGAENYIAIMDEERAKLKANEKTIKFIDGIVRKFFHDEEEELRDECREKSSLRTFLADVMERIRVRLPGKRESAEVEELPAPSEGIAEP